MTQIDLGNIRINWRGPYNNATDYVRHDAVSHQGSSYVAKRPVSGVTPIQGDDWDLMAAGTDQLTDEGDLLIHDGNTPVRLPKGDNQQTLQMVGNQPVWQNQSLAPSSRIWKLGKVNRQGGWYTRLYLMADGTIKACGYGGNNSNGDPVGFDLYIPSRVATEDPEVRFIDVFSGSMNHYGLTENGEVWSWGLNNYGQLGHGDTISRAIAKRIEYFVNNNIQIRHIVPGTPNYRDFGVAYFITTENHVYACGYNGQANIGNGTNTHQHTPVRCGTLDDVFALVVSSLPYTVYAIKNDGSLWVWGNNLQGQLGLGDISTRNVPTLNSSLNNVIQAIPTAGYKTDGTDSAGSGFALLADGSLWSTGYNAQGQLGHGDVTQRSSFEQIIHSENFTQIAVSDGRYGSVAALSNLNDIYLWGYNGYGQLGTGDATNQLSPFRPNGDFQGNVSRASIGGGSSYLGVVLQSNNQLWASGYNAAGNLGIGHNSSWGCTRLGYQ